MINYMRDEDDVVLTKAAEWLETGNRVALATVIATWGSSPRPVGALLTVSETGEFEGSVSGGCVEGAVIEGASKVIKEGSPRELTFHVSEEDAWSVGLACGGSITVYIERTEADTVQRVLDARLRRCAIARVVALQTGKGTLYSKQDECMDFPFGLLILGAVQNALQEGRSERVWLDGQNLFIRVFTPPPRLFVIGAVHIAQYLVSAATLAGFEVMLVDPRTAFATSQRFPQSTLVHEWPGKALHHLGLDEHSAVVTLTHDSKLDDQALTAALNSRAFYIGALGSKKTQAARLLRLERAGFSADQLKRIHGPAGLALGGRRPAEISIAIVAELIRARCAA